MNDEALARYLTPLLSKHPAMLSELACSADLPMKSCLRSGAVLGVEAVLFEKLLAADDAELSKLLHLAAVGVHRLRETVQRLAQDARTTARPS